MLIKRLIAWLIREKKPVVYVTKEPPAKLDNFHIIRSILEKKDK